MSIFRKMSLRIDVNWQKVVDLVYNIVKEQLGRGNAIDYSLARTLQVSGDYEVI